MPKEFGDDPVRRHGERDHDARNQRRCARKFATEKRRTLFAEFDLAKAPVTTLQKRNCDRAERAEDGAADELRGSVVVTLHVTQQSARTYTEHRDLQFLVQTASKRSLSSLRCALRPYQPGGFKSLRILG